MRGYKIFPLRLRNDWFINVSYLVVDGASGQAVLIDPAWQPDRIRQAVRNTGCRVTGILLTHAHADHTDLAGELSEEYRVPAYMSRVEIDHYDFSCARLVPLHDRQTLEVGGTTITGLLTPGHTAGSMCFSLPGALFTGDTVFIEGCGLCNGPGGSPVDMFHSIQRIKREIPGTTKIYPGHRYGRRPGAELRELLMNNVYFTIDSAEEFVAFRTRENQSGLFDFR